MLPRSRKCCERVEQFLIVARMKPDRRFVEHIKHAAQLRADLCRETNALAFAARERCRRAIEREITQADRLQKAQTVLDLAQYLTRRSVLRARSA